MSGAVAAVAVAALLAGATSPPPVDALFGCPLAAPAAAWIPPAGWTRHAVPEAGASVALPAGWVRGTAGGVVTFASADERWLLTLRRGHLLEAGQLARIRRDVELNELGPSHAGRLCEQRLAGALTGGGGLEAVEIGVYGRPLGGRQRSYALFGGLRDGSLTVTLRVRWSARAGGPDLDRVRHILGGIRAPEPGDTHTQDQKAGAPRALSSESAASASAGR